MTIWERLWGFCQFLLFLFLLSLPIIGAWTVWQWIHNLWFS